MARLRCGAGPELQLGDHAICRLDIGSAGRPRDGIAGAGPGFGTACSGCFIGESRETNAATFSLHGRGHPLGGNELQRRRSVPDFFGTFRRRAMGRTHRGFRQHSRRSGDPVFGAAGQRQRGPRAGAKPTNAFAARRIDHIQYLDSGFGWTSGEEQFPLPQNPFLLLTEDGGKTWTEHSVLRESTESPFGAVLEFSFSSKTTGSLILDRGQGSGQERYALFQSENGGQSWTIRQQSAKPLRLPQTAPPGGWRVRADAASRSYHIEHLQGERWSSLAAFAVNLDACKPPPEASGAQKP